MTRGKKVEGGEGGREERRNGTTGRREDVYAILLGERTLESQGDSVVVICRLGQRDL